MFVRMTSSATVVGISSIDRLLYRFRTGILEPGLIPSENGRGEHEVKASRASNMSHLTVILLERMCEDKLSDGKNLLRV